VKSRGFIGTAFERWRAHDSAGAVDTFLRGVCGPGYRPLLDRALPGAFEQHVADADTFFAKELPALQQWSFGPEDARRIVQPALAVIGARSREMDPIWNERHQLLLDWLPHVEPLVIPEATHLLQVENPRGVADGLAAFFARHPLGVSA
jgi:pimeloyl-ACP methyl ester carboxylesterase